MLLEKATIKQVADSNTAPVESRDWFAHSMLKASFVPVSPQCLSYTTPLCTSIFPAMLPGFEVGNQQCRFS